MAYKKGESGNPKGMKPGTKTKSGKTIQEIREAFSLILSNEIISGRIEQALKDCEAKDYLSTLTKFANLVLPSQIESNETAQRTVRVITIED